MDPLAEQSGTSRKLRIVALVLNSVVIIFFAAFLAYTFFARQHLNQLARGYVTEKTVEYSGPVVDLAESSLDSRLVRVLLTKNVIATIRSEIDDYRKDPLAYVSDLTQQQVQNVKALDDNPLLAKVAAIKQKIRVFYDNTLDALIQDLRIFSLSNLIASMIAWILAFRARTQIRKSIVAFSILMLFAVFYCSYMYIDGLTFFRILFRTHIGWWYPVVLGTMIVLFCLGNFQRPKPKEDNEESVQNDSQPVQP